MSHIEDLLRADAANTPLALELLDAFDPAARAAIETATELFETFNRCVARRFSDLNAQDDQQLTGLARELGFTDEQLIDQIQAGVADPRVESARVIWRRVGDRHPKTIVLLLLSRYFRWGMADLIRFHITAAYGYARLEAEACALLRLFIEEPQRADQWLQAGRSEEAGRRFFRETRDSLNAI